jgi:hypothetical protein
VIGDGGSTVTTCSYGGQGKDYVFTSCTGGFVAGDIVSSDAVTLTIVSGDATAGTTKVRAQLALNPVGDTIGRGVLPPMPTYWGDTAADSSQILSTFSTAVTAKPPTKETWVKTPVPDFARRTSDFRPVDTSKGPPPPNDPDFHKGGHANPGGSFDAYWALDGNLVTDESGGHNTVALTADFSTHAVLFGNDSTIFDVNIAANTDTGVVQQNGFQSPSARGSLHCYLFGRELSGSGDADPHVGFGFDITTGEQEFNLLPIPFWVFSITVGLTGEAGVSTSGSLSPAGVGLTITPHASFGAHLEGDIGIPGIIEGGLDVRVQLLTAALPFHANATWTVSTDPTQCDATVKFSAGGDVTVSSGGGEVDLEATFGPCPFCAHASTTLFSWDPLVSSTYNAFTIDTTTQAFSLPASLCQTTLQVNAYPPNNGGSVLAGAPTVLSGSALRPGTTGTNPQIVDCQYLTWTQSSDPDDVGLFERADGTHPVTGCNPTVTFPTQGTRTLTLDVTDQYGEKGQATVTFTVDPEPSQLTAYISQPPDGERLSLNGADPTIQVAGTYLPTSDTNVTYDWVVTVTDSANITTPFAIFGGQTGMVTPTRIGTYNIELIVNDGSQVATMTHHVIVDNAQ